ncbi:MAG TPA: beta-propeller fold lactonase family protein [Candidatus Acidoferrales bacterium]|nr:beta-propeller fold lactonase family protein [Candidatus Acidoferrales bacterium]
MEWTRRQFIRHMGVAAAAAALPFERALAQAPSGVNSRDRVILCNEDSNTLAVIDPNTNSVATTINLTSFDEDPRPPFRLVTGGVTPTHAAMVTKPLYHGAINIHGAAPSPDNKLLACTGRGTSNVYLIDLETLKVVGNAPNPQASEQTNPERLTSGVLVGREPHEPTFSRNGKELWVTVRGENRIAILDVAAAKKESRGGPARALRQYYPSLDGPAQAWFSADGRLAFVISQKTSRLEVVETNFGRDGYSRPKRRALIDIKAQDPFGFTPFEKTTPDGKELWLSHKLADAVSAWSVRAAPALLDTVSLGKMARPNHVEFVENANGKVVYVSLARVDDGGPGGVASSQIAIIDRSAAPGARKVVGTFFSHGREAHGLWTNPENTRLYIAHEQDELPDTPNSGQTVCSAFDVSDPFKPSFIAQIPLGDLSLPSGRLRNKKSINLVYVRPGARSQTA